MAKIAIASAGLSPVTIGLMYAAYALPGAQGPLGLAIGLAMQAAGITIGRGMKKYERSHDLHKVNQEALQLAKEVVEEVDRMKPGMVMSKEDKEMLLMELRRMGERDLDEELPGTEDDLIEEFTTLERHAQEVMERRIYNEFQADPDLLHEIRNPIYRQLIADYDFSGAAKKLGHYAIGVQG